MYYNLKYIMPSKNNQSSWMNWLKQSKLAVWQERDRNAIKLVAGFFFFNFLRLMTDVILQLASCTINLNLRTYINKQPSSSSFRSFSSSSSEKKCMDKNKGVYITT